MFHNILHNNIKVVFPHTLCSILQIVKVYIDISMQVCYLFFQRFSEYQPEGNLVMARNKSIVQHFKQKKGFSGQPRASIFKG